LKIPLRNPRKDEIITDMDEKSARSPKGIVLNQHATDGDDGQVKIRLDIKTCKNAD